MKFFIWLRNLWWARQRSIDLEILWPSIKDHVKGTKLTINDAHAAFAFHAFNDPCWIDFYGKDKLMKIIDQME